MRPLEDPPPPPIRAEKSSTPLRRAGIYSRRLPCGFRCGTTHPAAMVIGGAGRPGRPPLQDRRIRRGGFLSLPQMFRYPPQFVIFAYVGRRCRDRPPGRSVTLRYLTWCIRTDMAVDGPLWCGHDRTLRGYGIGGGPTPAKKTGTDRRSHGRGAQRLWDLFAQSVRPTPAKKPPRVFPGRCYMPADRFQLI